MANSNRVYGEDLGIPYARLAWVQLNPPKEEDRYTEAFSAKFLIDPNATEVLNKIKVACDQVAQQAFGTVKNIAMPLHDATDIDDDSVTAGFFYANAKSWFLPQLVDIKGHPIDPSAIYSGCYVQAVVRPASYVHQGKKGVGLTLVAIGFKKDGERLGASRDVQSIFAGAGLTFEEGNAPAETPAAAEPPKAAAKAPAKAAEATPPAAAEGELPFEFGDDTGFDI